MNNSFFSRFKCDSHSLPSYSPDSTDYTDSNFMYDTNKGITHIIYTDDNGDCRIVSDVEICMTDDPSVTSLFSSEYVNNLRNTILSKPHSKISNLDSKGDPIFNHSTLPLERDELDRLITSSQSDFFHDAVKLVNSSAPSSPHSVPTSVESPKTD